MIFYKYQGAGNDFLIADNREGSIHLTTQDIARLCHRRYGIGADGLMLLQTAPGYDFRMVYYNSDGSGGMMCGNGGRCIVAFANFCGIKSYRFVAADGIHEAEILGRDGATLTVKLRMTDVCDIVNHPDLNCTFLDTGTRHVVVPVTDIDNYAVVDNGRDLRYNCRFAPVGVNVNFIEPDGDVLRVRTYEKGVEDETYACGTGITASAIAYWHTLHPDFMGETQEVKQPVRTLRDNLEVDFLPTPEGAKDVYLIGPATYVAKIELTDL